MDINAKGIKIDWEWVKKELFEKERIPPVTKDGMKHVIHAAVDQCLKRARSLAKPRSVSGAKKIICLTPGSIEIEGDIIFSGRRMTLYIKGAADIYLFLVTIGAGIEEEASHLMSKGKPLYGYLMDRIGSLAVESLAEAFEEKSRTVYASEDKSVSMRLSPGYCDWPIEEQFLAAKALDFSKAGVSLTKNCMMVPRKSISAMVGIGPKTFFSQKKSPCVICDKRDCDYRRIVMRV